MKYLIDSNTIIDFFNGNTELFGLFDDEENIFVSAVSVGELLVKCAIDSDEHKKIAVDFCNYLKILPVDEEIAKKYGELRLSYPAVGENYLWLCATAIVKDMVLFCPKDKVPLVKEISVRNY